MTYTQYFKNGFAVRKLDDDTVILGDWFFPNGNKEIDELFRDPDRYKKITELVEKCIDDLREAGWEDDIEDIINNIDDYVRTIGAENASDYSNQTMPSSVKRGFLPMCTDIKQKIKERSK